MYGKWFSVQESNVTAFTSSAIQYMKCCTFFQLLQTVFAIQVKKGKLRSLFIIQCVRKHKQITFKINKLPKNQKKSLDGMYTDYTQVSIYMLLFPTRCSTLLDSWNMMRIEGARKAPLKPHKNWMGRTAISWSALHSLWLYLLQPYTVATWEERWASITSTINANPVIWGAARAIQGTLPSAASPQNSLCRTQHFKRIRHVLEWHGTNSSKQTPSEWPVQSSFVLHFPGTPA